MAANTIQTIRAYVFERVDSEDQREILRMADTEIVAEGEAQTLKRKITDGDGETTINLNGVGASNPLGAIVIATYTADDAAATNPNGDPIKRGDRAPISIRLNGGNQETCNGFFAIAGPVTALTVETAYATNPVQVEVILLG